MTRFGNGSFRAARILAVLGALLVGTGCGLVELLGKGMVGRGGRYDYSPSVIQSGNVRQIWWCGQATNPDRHSQKSDAILYVSIDLTTQVATEPVTVLAETPGAWDSFYSCNPKVVGGTFENPLGDGQTYQYAMYYVGTADAIANNIGVAFSNDGIRWNKYPQPVIRTSSPNSYGVGQPAVYNSDQKAAIWMFYEDDHPYLHHTAAISTDGVHFTTQGTLTTLGLDPDTVNSRWGDMAYDSTNGYWYAVFNRPVRDYTTTGKVYERGQYGVELYRIPKDALLTGSAPWQQLHTIDTNLTGFESNFLAGLVRDPYGTVNVASYPAIQMYISISNPPPTWDADPGEAGTSGRIDTWDLAPVAWAPGNPLMPLYQYSNKHVRWVTTGWINPYGNFHMDSTLGHLYESPQQGATVPFYGCKRGSRDYFVSLDSGCEGDRILGRNGYGYSQPVAGLTLIPLYRCSTDHDHFVSQDSACEGNTTDELLGYVVP